MFTLLDATRRRAAVFRRFFSRCRVAAASAAAYAFAAAAPSCRRYVTVGH